MYDSSKGKEIKSSFATTCNRLSTFLREKGSLRGLEINPNFDVTEKQETKSGPMTVFYGGQVLVFDNISDDKARDLMLLASGSCITNNQIQNRAFSNMTCKVDEGLDLPIARRASLHKFLARRMDRAAVRPTPYPLTTAPSSSKYKFDLNF